MKKKAILATAIALVTASAMTFAPVSYKVIDKTYAASSNQNIVDANETAKKVLAELKSEPKLVEAYEAAVQVVGTQVSTIDVTKLDHLEANLNTLNSGSGDLNKLNTAIQAVITAAVEQYKKVANIDFAEGLASDELEEAIAELNDELAHFGVAAIDKNELVDFVADVKDELFAKFEAGEFDLDIIENGSVTDEAKEVIKELLSEKWDENSTFSAALKYVYGNQEEDKEDMLEDLEAAANEAKATLTADQKQELKLGAAALAVAYAKYYLKSNPIVNPENPSNTSGPKYYYSIDYSTKLNLLTQLVKFEVENASRASVELESIEDTLEQRLVLNLGSVNSTRTVTVEAKLDGAAVGIPAEFDGVVLFSFDQRHVVGGSVDTGEATPAPTLTLVNDYLQKATDVSTIIDQVLAETPDLVNNSEVLKLKLAIEQQLRDALLVQAAAATTIVNGVTTLNVTPAQMELIYTTQLNAALNAAQEALIAKGIELKVNPTLVYNLGVSANAELKVSQALIDSLKSKGIVNVGAKSGDAVVEANLAQLNGATSISIKKSASTVSGAKSDQYSINVTNAAGQSVSGFEKQYRVTLPVNGSGANVTVAKVTDGTLTYLNSSYDAATGTVSFYTNEPGEFVVVEHTATINDLDKTPWAKEAIQKLVNQGLLNGKGNGQFDPTGEVTRAEFTAMLTRAFNLSLQGQSQSFTDVTGNAWYFDAVATAKAYGIVNGRTATTFDPNAEISREEMATMAANALKAVLEFNAPSGAEAVLGQFVDGASVAPVHQAGVALLADEGIVQGKGANNYDPKGTASRAEAASILGKLTSLR